MNDVKSYSTLSTSFSSLDSTNEKNRRRERRKQKRMKKSEKRRKLELEKEKTIRRQEVIDGLLRDREQWIDKNIREQDLTINIAGGTILHFACAKGLVNTVQSLIRLFPHNKEFLMSRNSKGETALEVSHGCRFFLISYLLVTARERCEAAIKRSVNRRTVADFNSETHTFTESNDDNETHVTNINSILSDAYYEFHGKRIDEDAREWAEQLNSRREKKKCQKLFKNQTVIREEELPTTEDSLAQQNADRYEAFRSHLTSDENIKTFRSKDFPWPSLLNSGMIPLPLAAHSSLEYAFRYLRVLQSQWHPDKVQQRFVQHLNSDEDLSVFMQSVTEISQKINILRTNFEQQKEVQTSN